MSDPRRPLRIGGFYFATQAGQGTRDEPYVIRASIDAGNVTLTGDINVGAVTVSNFPATQPVSGAVSVANFPVTQPVSGAVSVSNFPATQPVSGTVALGAGSAAIGTVTVAGNVADDAVDSGNPIKIAGKAYAPDSGPTDVQSGDRKELFVDLKGRVNTIRGDASDPANDGICHARAVPQAIAITTSGAGYVAADVVGGIISITAVNYASGRRVTLQSLVLKDKGGTAPGLHIYFFKATPSGGTYTDNSALVWGSGDSANIVDVIDIASGDWATDVSQSTVSLGSQLKKMAVSATTLFMLIISQTSQTITNGNLTAEAQFDAE